MGFIFPVRITTPISGPCWSSAPRRQQPPDSLSRRITGTDFSLPDRGGNSFVFIGASHKARSGTQKGYPPLRITYVVDGSIVIPGPRNGTRNQGGVWISAFNQQVPESINLVMKSTPVHWSYSDQPGTAFRRRDKQLAWS